MKIRNGFVSNSSSSSFIVVWDKKPKSAEEVDDILFPNYKQLTHYTSEDIKSIDIANIIFRDTGEATFDEILNELSNLLYFDPFYKKWEDYSYKLDENLKKQCENEMLELLDIEKKCEDIINRYSDSEIENIIRTEKFKRILNKENSIENINLYIDTRNKLEEVREKMYNEKIYNEPLEDSTTRFVKEFKDKFIAIYEYEDHTQHEAFIESNGFSPLYHIRISKH